jgi:hypothetical protein
MKEHGSYRKDKKITAACQRSGNFFLINTQGQTVNNLGFAGHRAKPGLLWRYLDKMGENDTLQTFH